MKQARKNNSDNGMLNEYDFTRGIRGKYTKRYASGTNIVVLAPDVSKVFSGSKSVNRVLRAIVRNIRRVA